MDYGKKILKPGVNVKLCPENAGKPEDEQEELPSYYSKISDVKDDGLLEIYMPTQQGKLQLLSAGKRMYMYCYAGNGVYEADVVVKERYKSDDIHFVILQMTGELKKNQRREYYRYQCTIPMQNRLMDADERKWMTEQDMLVVDDALPMEDSMLVDISGGGLQFIGAKKYVKDDMVYCRFQFGKNYRLCTCILESVGNIANHPGKYRSRARFVGVERREREEIIRYIFTLERAKRKLERE